MGRQGHPITGEKHDGGPTITGEINDKDKAVNNHSLQKHQLCSKVVATALYQENNYSVNYKCTTTYEVQSVLEKGLLKNLILLRTPRP